MAPEGPAVLNGIKSNETRNCIPCTKGNNKQRADPLKLQMRLQGGAVAQRIHVADLYGFTAGPWTAPRRHKFGRPVAVQMTALRDAFGTPFMRIVDNFTGFRGFDPENIAAINATELSELRQRGQNGSVDGIRGGTQKFSEQVNSQSQQLLASDIP